MLDTFTKKDIEKISFEILKGSNSFDVFPTPIDKIVSYSELIVSKEIDLSKIDSGYFSKGTNILRCALSKVRGLLDRSQRTIYLDLSQGKPRQGFVKLHEVGHDVLPWQKEMYQLLEDDDNSLALNATEQFEEEANYFASLTLFQYDRFATELNKFNLGIESSIQLSKMFGASVHATLRRYVEFSKKRCALIVLNDITGNGNVFKCAVRDRFQSKKFSKCFGEILIPEELGYNWNFVKDYYYDRKFITKGTISLPTENGENNFTYQFFNNGFNGLVFIFPFGEQKH